MKKIVPCSWLILAILITVGLKLNGQTQLLTNGNFDGSTSSPWILTGSAYVFSAPTFTNYNSYPKYAAIPTNSSGTALSSSTGSVKQTFNIPSNATNVVFSYYYKITTLETTTTSAFDVMTVILTDQSGNTCTTTSRSNLNFSSSYQFASFNVCSNMIGKTVTVTFSATNDGAKETTFRIDDVSVTATIPASYPDLTITAGTQALSNYSPTMGSTITAYASEDNSGTVPAGANVVSIHLSSDGVLTPGLNGDTYLGEINIPSVPGLSNSLVYNTTIQIPCNINPGTYYIFFSADGGGAVSESNESNNQATRQVTISSSVTDTYEANNTAATASTTLPVLSYSPLSTTRSSYIFSSSDADWYYLGIDYDGTFTINLTNLPANYDIELWNSSGTAAIAGSYNSGTNNEQITYNYTTPQSTWFYIKVYGNGGTFNKCTPYNLGLVWGGSCPLTGLSLSSSSPGSTTAGVTTISTLTPTFSWNSVANATSYSIYVRDVTTNTLYSFDCSATNSPWTIPAGYLINGHSYRWNMRADYGTCSTCTSALSSLRYFDVNLCSATPPSTCSTTIGTPANGIEHHTNLSCSPVTGVDGYAFEYSFDGSVWYNLPTTNSSSYNYDVNNQDNPNSRWYYRVRTYCGSTYSAYRSANPFPIYTACDNPVAPTVIATGPNTLTVTLNEESPVPNPSNTTYAIYCPTTGQYIQVNGSLALGAYYQTMANWGTITVTGLNPGSQYCFYAIAMNVQGDIRYNSLDNACASTLASCGPFFTAHPASTTVCTNSTAFFTISASSTSSISYQWKKGSANLSNGSKYQGVNTPNLTIYNCNSGDVASYSCVATSCSVSSQSNTASLSVTGTISPDPSFHSTSNNISAGDVVTLTVNNPCGGCTYTWSKTGGTTLGTTATSTQIRFSTPGTYTVRLTATNATCGGITNSSTGFITVRPTPTSQAPMQPLQAISNQYPSGYAADPVNLALGNYHFNRTLSKFKVVGGELNFTVFYNSLATDYYAGKMGPGWSHSFDYRIIRQADVFGVDTIWRVHYPDLHETDFIVLYQGSGKSFPLHHGVFDQLTKDPTTGNFQLKLKNQLLLNFDSTGALLTMVDRSSNTTNLAYTGNKLISVTGPGGRSFTLSYTDSLLTSVTDPIGQVVFGYTSGNLTSMSDAEGNNTTFTYNAFNEMENVRNPLLNYVVRNHYTNHKVDSQLDGNSQITTFLYNTPVTGAATVNYPDGSDAVFYHDTLYRLIRYHDEEDYDTYISYDYNHLPVSIKDVSGFTTTAVYDTMGNQKEIHRPHNVNVYRQFNTTNDLVQLTDAESNVTTISRDPVTGNITAIDRPGNNDEAYSYFSTGLVRNHTNGRGIQTSFVYNSFGDLTQIIAPKGVWNLGYDTRGRNRSVINPLGDSTTRAFDRNDNVSLERDEEGYTIQHQFDANQNEITVTDRNNHPLYIDYDLKDRPFRVRDIAGNSKKIDYNLRDVKTKFTDERSNYVEFTVNHRGDIKAVRNKLGGLANLTLDNAGNPIDGQSAINVNFHRALDSLYRELGVNIAGIINNSKVYDGDGRIKQYVDGRGNTKSVQFDGVGNPYRIIDEAGNPTDVTYDGNGNIINLIDPNGAGHYTQVIYDQEDNDSLSTDAIGLTERKIYNAAGDLVTLIKPDVTANFTYYKNHRVKDISYSTGEAFHFVYDGNGNTTDATGPNGTEHYVFNNLDRLTSYTDFNGKTIEYTYDPAGNTSTIKYPGNKQLDYLYNENNQVTSVKAVWINKTWSFEYDLAGNLTRINYPNNYKAQVTLDAAGRVQRYRNYNATTQKTIYQDSVWRDGNDNIDSNAITGWWPDSLASGLWSYSYKNNNEMSSDGHSNYSWNGHGALLQQVYGNDTMNCTWSGNDLLMNINRGSAAVAFKYDAFLRLSGINRNGSQTFFLNDVSQTLHRPAMAYNTNGVPTAIYIYGNGLIGMIDSAGNLFNYHYDMYGNTMFLTNDTGAVTDKYTYADPFGTVYKHEGSSFQPFLFLGKYGIIAINDSIYNIRARFYQSTTGRFLSKDPYYCDVLSSQTIHRYVYALNNATVYHDITGLYGNKDNSNRFLNGLQTVFTIAGLIPGIGEFFDLANAGIYLARGDYLNASLSAASAIPIAGEFVAAGKLELAAVKAGSKLEKVSGSYLIEFESGIFYAGKGLEPRMNQSIKRLETTYGDKAIKSTFFPAPNETSAFINEHKIMMENGGPKSLNPLSPTYNKIFSPGKSLGGF